MPDFTARRSPITEHIERHTDRPEEFYCRHPEMEGRYVVKKPSFGLDLQVERTKAAILGVPNPTEAADTMAEWAAVWECAFSEKPKDVKLDDIVDSRAIAAVYGEVVSFWKCFRG